MKCPECEAQGLRSTVQDPGGGFSTCMGIHRYYDEDGRWHVHDPNYTSYMYRCSNGHEWDGAKPNKCPSCDYEGGGSYRALQQRWRDAAATRGNGVEITSASPTVVIATSEDIEKLADFGAAGKD